MSSPRERQLAEGIKNKLLSIHKCEQVYKTLSKWEKKVVQMSQKEIQEAANTIASKVEQYAVTIEKRTKKQPDANTIMKKIKQELEKI